MSSFHDVKGLINLGRKAGLRTSDLYPALATRPPEGSENPLCRPTRVRVVRRAGADRWNTEELEELLPKPRVDRHHSSAREVFGRAILRSRSGTPTGRSR